MVEAPLDRMLCREKISNKSPHALQQQTTERRRVDGSMTLCWVSFSYSGKTKNVKRLFIKYILIQHVVFHRMSYIDKYTVLLIGQSIPQDRQHTAIRSLYCQKRAKKRDTLE